MSSPNTLSTEQIEIALQELSGWNPTESETGRSEIRKGWEFASFVEAMTWVNEVAQLAEELNHHPDIEIRFNKVVLSLSSHDAGGVTKRDLRLAREIEKLGE